MLFSVYIIFNIIVIFSRITGQYGEKHKSVITRVLFDKKSIWTRIWSFTFFEHLYFLIKYTSKWAAMRHSPQSTQKNMYSNFKNLKWAVMRPFYPTPSQK